MDSNKHTQGQLSFDKSDLQPGFKVWTIEAMPKIIATVHTEDVDTDDEGKANAERIVKAWNNYNQLLEALQWIEHHALQDGCSKESLKAVAKAAIEQTEQP